MTDTKKEAPKRYDINAEWIKKEKLTVMETKETKKQEARNKVQVNKQQLEPGRSVNEEEGA